MLIIKRMDKNKFKEIFGVNKPIIGMIHLAGLRSEEKVERALEELLIYEQEGVDGAIIEDYHGGFLDVYETLKQSSKMGLNIVRGVNILRNPYEGFELAKEHGAKFVQFNSIQTKDLDLNSYMKKRIEYSEIAVLGGVRFKDIAPTGNSLEVDLMAGVKRCEAIVTTGSGTGVETPIEKLKEFKNYLTNFPLVAGSGVDLNNVNEQLKIADAAIIGSYFKPDKNTRLPIDREKVRKLMDIVKTFRK